MAQTRRRPKQLLIRFDEDEARMLEALAKRLHLSKSATVRFLIAERYAAAPSTRQHHGPAAKPGMEER